MLDTNIYIYKIKHIKNKNRTAPKNKFKNIDYKSEFINVVSNKQLQIKIYLKKKKPKKAHEQAFRQHEFRQGVAPKSF